MNRAADRELIEKLKLQISGMQERRSAALQNSDALGLGEMESAFPGKIFPRGAVHELMSQTPENAASTNGFIALLLSRLMQQNSYCLWVSTRPLIFPAALKTFGLSPERVLFIDISRIKDALWTIEEALKCKELSAVVGEISDLDFNQSRRLQLAVERSKVTGLIHRYQPKANAALACVTRWKVAPVPGLVTDDLPGLGFPAWRVQLLKVRGGKPGEWLMHYSPKGIGYFSRAPKISHVGYLLQSA